MWSAVGRWLSFSETRMSASEVPDHVRGAVDPVDGAVGQADVVEDHVELRGRDLAPDRGLHQVRDARRLLDAGAGLGPHVQADLAAVGVREEVPPQVRREQEREQADAEEDRDEEPAVLRQAREQVAIAAADLLEAPLEMVAPSMLSTITDDRIDSGIDTAMMRVLRQLPRKTRIMTAVRHADDRLPDHSADRGPARGWILS